MRHRVIWETALAAGLLVVVGGRPATTQTLPQVDLRWGVQIPLRDGVHLNATLYLPKEGGPQPVIFTLTPYLGDSYHERGMYFAQHGYAFALVDVRGRGNSEGEFDPFTHEAIDGYDTVEWLAKQSWCNGKVAMWGGSYAGYDQWAVAKERPPHLTTIVPVAAVRPGIDFPMSNNIFEPYMIQWRTFTSGKGPNANLFGDSSFWTAKYRDLYVNHRAFHALDELAGNPSATFQTWVAHPQLDPYWDAMSPTTDQYRQLSIPILSITGHFDGDQRGALTFYKEFFAAAMPDERERHYLVIGPWDHAGTRKPRKEVGGLTIADAGLLDMNKLHREWYDWTMKNGPKPEFLRAPVAYYVLGAEQWKYASSWEAMASEWRSLYLHSGGAAGDAFAGGSLAVQRPQQELPDHYTEDPLDSRPEKLEEEAALSDTDVSLVDQHLALSLFGEGVEYHSAPFDAPTELSGMARAHLWMSLDVPDTDIEVLLYEIKRDGSSLLLGGDRLRARYRTSTRHPQPVTSGAVQRYDFTLDFTSRQVEVGSRLRFVVHGLNSLNWEKNYNSGGVVADETAKDARTAHVMVYHDASHSSVLEIPIVH
jgi:putative CocE/NonD family hydrolase